MQTKASKIVHHPIRKIMKGLPIFLAVLGCATSFSTQPQLYSSSPLLLQCAKMPDQGSDDPGRKTVMPRREALLGIAAFVTPAITMGVHPAFAIPMVSVDEFYLLLRDAALSVEVVEFTGPKSETVTVRLVDGTTFGIKDVIESPTDPRSPLKVSAACRENGVKTRFVNLESILAKAPKRKKMYTNQRVQDANEKEREKRERIQRDEEERLAALRKLEAQEFEAASTAESSSVAQQ